MKATEISILQVFNCYLERGGEEQSVERIGDVLGPEGKFHSLRFRSKDWSGPEAPPIWRQALWMWHNPASVRLLRQSISDNAADIVLFHNVFPVGSAALYREVFRAGVPSVQYIHNFRPFSVNGYLWAGDRVQTAGLRKNFIPEIMAGSWQNSRVKTGWYAGVIRMMHALGYWRSVTAWVAISEFMRSTFIEAGVPAERIFTVRHSWDPCEEEPTYGPRANYVFLGRLITAKGLKCLVAAWHELHTQLGSQCPQLVIAGEGPLEPWVREQTAANPAIVFKGFLTGENKSQVLATCRALIAPSIWWEPLGLVVYEAYDHGTPVLAARSGGLTETVVPGETGLLHSPGNVAELVRDVLALEADATLSERLGRQGRRWLLANTNARDWRQKLRAVFEYAAAQKQRPSRPPHLG